MEKLNEYIEFLEMAETDPQLLVWLLELRRHRENNWQQRAEENQEVIEEYNAAMCVSNEAGYAGVTAAQTIRHLMERAEAAEAALERESDIHIDTAASMREWRLRAEAAEAKLAELEKQEESRWNTHEGIARPIGVDKDDLVYLRMKRQEIKLPYPAGMVNWKHDGGEFDVIAWASVYSSYRPAPAINLAELVPPMKDDSIPGKNDSYIDMCDGWNSCRAAIIRNIEAAK